MVGTVLEEDIISGKNLTINPDIKYRRDRYVSAVRSHKRAAKTKQFLNYCSYIVGDRDTFDNISTVFFDSILLNIKKGKFNKIPHAYYVLYMCYKELIERTIETMARRNAPNLESFEKYLRYRIGELPYDKTLTNDYYSNIISNYKKGDLKKIATIYRDFLYSNIELAEKAARVTQKDLLSRRAAYKKPTETIKNKSIEIIRNKKNLLKYKEGYDKFFIWVQNQLNKVYEPNEKFAMFVVSYNKHGYDKKAMPSYVPKYVYDVCKQFKDIDKYKRAKGNLVEIEPVEVEPAKIKSVVQQTLDAEFNDKVDNEIKVTIPDNLNKVSTELTTNHLITLIQTLKAAGLSEIILKF